MTTVRQSELKVSITLQQNATRHPSPRSWEAEFSECCSPHTRHQAAPARRTALALRHATRHPGMSASRLERPDLSRDPRAVSGARNAPQPQSALGATCPLRRTEPDLAPPGPAALPSGSLGSWTLFPVPCAAEQSLPSAWPLSIPAPWAPGRI